MWRRADPDALPALRGFLCRREWACCSLSSRVLRSGELHLPPPRGARLFAWIPEGSSRSLPPPAGGILLCSADGNLYPALYDSPPEGDRELVALAEIEKREPSVCLGLEADVRRMEAALGLESADGNDYFLMTLESRALQPSLQPPVQGLEAFKPGRADLGGLYPLQAAYEKEEVLAAMHRHDPEATRSALAASVEGQAMLCARLSGRIVAKAQTNARGMSWDQLGGIFVDPEYRGRGIGTWIVALLCDGLLRSGRKLTLFVKKKNAAAIASYRKIGFSFRDSFRISYYS